MSRPATATSEAQVWETLSTVSDPEIPAISVVDLGVIGSVEVDGRRIRVELLPTFVGCPAIGVMQAEIAEVLRAGGLADEVEVPVVFDPPWTSDRISETGRERLRLSGFAPPAPMPPGPALGQLDELAVLPVAECPYCRSRNTTMENPFGPTLCRAIYHCADCRQPFEQFKRI
ncbi:MAG TPA: 1,2-phenylacetyl-CoA epoxidase subunit PaaD [Candidatus Angelobacter sp.]|nr:1,2-phenylacetyl-CoA epoxidase subunit PaaD [Candidatus Angelobacter sp.]